MIRYCLKKISTNSPIKDTNHKRRPKTMRRHLLLFCIISFAIRYGYATTHYQNRKQLQHRDSRRREQQSSCSAPEKGCGYGLFDISSCSCKCIPSYCFDDLYQQCATVRSFGLVLCISCVNIHCLTNNTLQLCTSYVNKL